MYYPVLIAISFLAIVVLSGCVPVNDRLVPSGETITVSQGKQFCSENPGDSACSN